MSHSTMRKDIQKYVMALESEKNLYITGSTILAMKGIISYEEYITNNIKKNIRRDILDEKFYLQNILGAIRGMTRFKLVTNINRTPSVTMYQRMREEDEEIEANGGRFSPDCDFSLDEYSNDLTSASSKSKKNRWKDNNLSTDSSNSLSKRPYLRGRNERVRYNYDNDEILPQELNRCGDCGMKMRNVEHLNRHLERCRGSPRNQQKSLRRLCAKRYLEDCFLGVELASVDTPKLGQLTVGDTEDGELIDGWGSLLQDVPPGPTCPRCSFQVPTLYDLPLHQKFHTKSETVECPVCPFSTKSVPEYLLHVENHAL